MCYISLSFSHWKLRNVAFSFHMTANFQNSIFFIIKVSPRQWFQILPEYWIAESKASHFSFELLGYLFLLFLFWKGTHSQQAYINFGESGLLQTVPSGILVFSHCRKKVWAIALVFLAHAPSPFSLPFPLLTPKKREVIKTDRAGKFFISQTYRHSRKEQTYCLLTCIVL